MTPATAILVPVLNRPQNIRPLVESIETATPEPHSVLFLASAGDTAEEKALLEAVGVDDAGLRPTAQQDLRPVDWMTVGVPGTWAQKINEGFMATEEPFVFLAADDLRFHDGWLTEALDVMENAYGIVDVWPTGERTYTPTCCVVGTNDLCNERTWSRDPRWVHSTHTLVRRAYIDQLGGTLDKGPGVVLAEEYPHEYADDEFVETAKHRGVYAHAYDSLVEHLHPLCGKAAQDDTYALGRSRTRDSRRIYNERAERLGFAPPRWQSSRHAGLLARRARGEGE